MDGTYAINKVVSILLIFDRILRTNKNEFDFVLNKLIIVTFFLLKKV